MRLSIGRRKPICRPERIVRPLAPAVEPVPVMPLRPGNEHRRHVAAVGRVAAAPASDAPSAIGVSVNLHDKAMPVMLMTVEDTERWLTGR